MRPGWNFSCPSPADHETRYRLGQEWFDIVKKCWSDGEGDFDWDGEFYQLKGVHSFPKPVNGTIPVFNAGGSKEGKAFATRNAAGRDTGQGRIFGVRVKILNGKAALTTNPTVFLL